MNELQAFLTSPAGLAVKGILIVSFLDFATGVFAAIRDGSFALDALAAFVRKHIAGRVLPLTLLLVTGYYAGEVGQLFMAAALAGGAAYVAESVASIQGNVFPPKPSDVVKADEAAGAPAAPAAAPSTRKVPTD